MNINARTQSTHYKVYKFEVENSFYLQDREKILEKGNQKIKLETRGSKYQLVSITRHRLTFFKGVGEPVDELDELCKKWQKCRACTMVDNQWCDQRTFYNVNLADLYTYTYNTWQGRLPQEPVPHCIPNAPSCEYNICRCDVEFATQLATMLFEKGLDQVVHFQYVTGMGGKTGFDHKYWCKVGLHGEHLSKPLSSNQGTSNGQPTGPSNWQSSWPSIKSKSYTNCCGDYPQREPYNNQRQTCCYERQNDNLANWQIAFPFLTEIGSC